MHLVIMKGTYYMLLAISGFGCLSYLVLLWINPIMAIQINFITLQFAIPFVLFGNRYKRFIDNYQEIKKEMK